MKIKIFLLVILFCNPNLLLSQNTRLNTNHKIGWYNYFGTFQVSKKFSFHTEYQLRRNEIVTQWQQSLLRLGVNYQLNPKVQLRFGYAWVETFAYGEIPLNSMGKSFSEYRIFQIATITDKVSIIDLSHRFMLEQRWIGRYSNASLTSEDEFPLIHRFRYMFRMQAPLKGKEIRNKTPYAAMYNELFIGFGKNVNENIFDQNRFGILLGYRLSHLLRIEAGYLNQTLQLGREVSNRNVFQYNNGLIVNVICNFNLIKKNNLLRFDDKKM